MHATIFTAALAVAGKEAVLCLPERFTIVTLSEYPAGRKTAASGNEKKLEPLITAEKPAIKLREVSPPEVPRATQGQDKDQLTAVPQRTDISGVGTGIRTSSTAGDNTATLQTGGVPGTSTGATQPAIPGKTASQGGQEGVKNKTASQDRDIVNTIKAAIERAKSYPPLARKRGIEGTAAAEFTVNSRGYPENIRIVRSSGSDILDIAAKKTVLRASPFPAVNGSIEVPITFRIEK